MTVTANLHQRLSSPITLAITSTFESNMNQSTFHLILHHNVIQHASTARSQHVARPCLHGHAAARNGSMIILITWINSLLSIYFKYLWGVSSTTCININISNFYDGFFTQKWRYNNNPYKSLTNKEFFDAIWNQADAAARIRL